ncbi:signal recognition particle 9 kDa protein-domain-containing protein [Lasiosphaeria hispida]|uniref:Signal recognition particle 9 kDa protein-domain-containing protein n=1 Tax=Lasiosphaeria hispida TaxID=260671 RepID=A0AAJ0HLZ0_9PEZI|nr:signal recognition particle 9 kDa protein-domain-containing protein [Lasiosphaeria hispida]
MPYYEKSEDWLQQSALLLQARPSTTRITTRYHLKLARRRTKAEKTVAPDTTTITPLEPTTQATKPPRGHLVLKTYDPASGTALKYKTSKAAEVGRLVQMLGTLGRRMAALPEVAVVPVVEDAGEGGSGVQTPVPAEGPPGGGQAGGKGKKRKGKR